jgi:hypothetical protein
LRRTSGGQKEGSQEEDRQEGGQEEGRQEEVVERNGLPQILHRTAFNSRLRRDDRSRNFAALSNNEKGTPGLLAGRFYCARRFCPRQNQ